MKNDSQILIWVDESKWDKETRGKFLADFAGFNPQFDQKAAIGAGASGLWPEINILWVLGPAAAIFGKSFLEAAGEDTWEILKGAMKKLFKARPTNFDPELLKMGVPPKVDVIWWVYFPDKQFLVHLPSSSEEETQSALELLPQAVDSSLIENPNFVRLIWESGKWKRI